MTIRAVIFDWRGTLVEDPPIEVWVRAALAAVQRSEVDLDRYVHGMAEAAARPEVIAFDQRIDTDARLHRELSMRFFELAGFDEELAVAFYELDRNPALRRFYPDALESVQALHERGIRVGLLSDIHLDLRPDFVAAGLDPFMDSYVLSFEHGVQKPDPAIFEISCRELGVAPRETLMVGDRASHDGGGAAAGLLTLIFPRLPEFGPRGLDRVVALTG